VVNGGARRRVDCVCVWCVEFECGG
jgi:hypothetical protein